MKNKVFITGTVNFYGKVNKVKFDAKGNKKTLDEKEYSLSLTDIEVSGLTRETLNEMYEGCERIADWAEKLVAGVTPDILFFHSDYPVDEVRVKTQNGNVLLDLSDNYPGTEDSIELVGARVKMLVNKSYIGRLLILENGEGFDPFN